MSLVRKICHGYILFLHYNNSQLFVHFNIGDIQTHYSVQSLYSTAYASP